MHPVVLSLDLSQLFVFAHIRLDCSWVPLFAGIKVCNNMQEKSKRNCQGILIRKEEKHALAFSWQKCTFLEEWEGRT